MTWIRAATILSLAFFFVELLDPTTSFVRVPQPPSHKQETSAQLKIQPAVRVVSATQALRPVRHAAAHIAVTQLKQWAIISSKVGTQNLQLNIPKLRYLFYPIKICPDDDLT